MENQTDYTNFGDVARERLGQQCQYASRYICGEIPGYPTLGKGLRFKNKGENYHLIEIHKNDVEEFVRRYNQYQKDILSMYAEDIHEKYEIKQE